jgi:hypothetical protein
MIIIPAYCPTCHALFPSGFAIGEGVTAGFDGNVAGPCPNGHMGQVLDGTISAINGVLHLKEAGKVSKHVLERIQALASDAQKGRVDPQDALDEALALLPSELSAAIRKLKAPPLVLITLAVILLTSVIASNLTTALKNVYSSDSGQNVTINENNTFNFYPTQDQDTLSRQQKRRIELKRQKAENRARARAKK